MLLAALLLAQTAPAPQCTAIDAALPEPLAGWTGPKAATIRAGMPGPGSTHGIPYRVKEDQRPGGVVQGGFRIAEAGTYGVAIDQPGWIDVFDSSGKPVQSVRHEHGPECSTIRKIVYFKLEPGEYRSVVTGLPKPDLKVMLVEGS